MQLNDSPPTPLPEEWRDVPGYVGRYEVSNLGGVRTIARKIRIGAGHRYVPVINIYQAKVSRGSTPYMQVTLWVGHRGKTFKTHALVLAAFIGPKPEGMQCRHLDGDSLRNHADNLEWGTVQQNIADRTMHGRHFESLPRRLSPEAIHQIQTSRESAKSLAALYGVTPTTIYNRRRGSTCTPKQ